MAADRPRLIDLGKEPRSITHGSLSTFVALERSPAALLSNQYTLRSARLELDPYTHVTRLFTASWVESINIPLFATHGTRQYTTLQRRRTAHRRIDENRNSKDKAIGATTGGASLNCYLRWDWTKEKLRVMPACGPVENPITILPSPLRLNDI